MKRTIKTHKLTHAEEADLELMEEKMIGHRPQDYPSYAEYFRNEIVIPYENFFKENA